MRKILYLDYTDHRGNPARADIQIDVEKITEYQAAGEGDKWYYDIHYNNGRMLRIFNPDRVMFAREGE